MLHDPGFLDRPPMSGRRLDSFSGELKRSGSKEFAFEILREASLIKKGVLTTGRKQRPATVRYGVQVVYGRKRRRRRFTNRQRTV